MSGILQQCPRCKTDGVRLIGSFDARAVRCTRCLDLKDADLSRPAPSPSGDARRSELTAITACPTCGAPATMPTKSTSNGLTGPALVTQGTDTYRYAPSQSDREAAAFRWLAENVKGVQPEPHYTNERFRHATLIPSFGAFTVVGIMDDDNERMAFGDTPLEAVENAAAIHQQSPTRGKT